MAAWPGTLPVPSYNGFSLKPSDNTIRTDMEFGGHRTRTRTKARNDNLSVTWEFSDTQMAAFRTWYEDPAQASYGAAWFTMSVPIGTTGLTTQTVRFIGIWEATLSGGMNWVVTAKLEVR